VHGRGPALLRGHLSHAAQDYPEFEISSVSVIRMTRSRGYRAPETRVSQRRIEIVVVETGAPNAQSWGLAELAKRDRYPLLLVNDSGHRSAPGYLRAVTAPLRSRKSDW